MIALACLLLLISTTSAAESATTDSAFEEITTVAPPPENSTEEALRAHLLPANYSSVAPNGANEELEEEDPELKQLFRRKGVNSKASTIEEFWRRRNSAADEEIKELLGHDQYLSKQELKANEHILSLKYEDYDLDIFLPSRNFYEVKAQIEQTEIFRVIKRMPKGANLYVLLITSLDFEFIYQLTFEDHLYFYYDGELNLKFSEKSPGPRWKLLSQERESGNREYVEDLNSKIRKALTLVVSNPDDADEAEYWDKFISVLRLYTSLTVYKPNFVRIFWRMLEILYEDNILYAEVGYSFTDLYDIDGKIYDAATTLEICIDILKEFKKSHDDFIAVRFVYASLTSPSVEELRKERDIVVKLWKDYPRWIVGFGYGFGAPYTSLSILAEEFIKFPKDLKLMFAAGATKDWGTDADYNILDAYALNAATIAEAIAITKHPHMLHLMRNSVVLNYDPILAQVMNLVYDLRHHPLTLLVAIDYPVVLGSVGGTCYNATGLSYNFYEAYIAMTPKFCDLRCLKKFAWNSILYSNTSDEVKKLIAIKWKKRWNEFIEYVIRTYD